MNRMKTAQEKKQKERPLLSALAATLLRSAPEGNVAMTLTGLWGSAKAAVISGLAVESAISYLVLASSETQAEALYQDLKSWLRLLGQSTNPLVYFPSTETLPYELTPPHPDLVRRRMLALHRLSTGPHGALPITVTSVPAILRRVMKPAWIRKAARSIRPGAVLDRDRFMESLAAMGYVRNKRVEHPGEFSVRGSILDLFSTGAEDPVRIDWSGDQIDSLRTFGPETQLSTTPLSEVWILPASEPVEEAEATLMDYLPRPMGFILDEPGRIRIQMDEFESEVRLARSSLTADPARFRDRYITADALEARFRSGPMIRLESLSFQSDPNGPPMISSARSPETVGLGVQGTPLSASLKTLEAIRQNALVLFLARTPLQRDRILDLFRDHDLPAGILEEGGAGLYSRSDLPLPFLVGVGSLSGGFVDTAHHLAVLTDEDLFGKSARHRPILKSKRERFLSSLEDLEEGNFVVHVQHGIARYEGLKRLSIRGTESDFLILNYLGGDRLYLPVESLNLVQKYVGVEGHRPKMDRLGGLTWARTTRRVRKAVETMAREIMELYAAREITPGHSYAGDSNLTREFDAAFPYEETPDQRRTIDEVKGDMERPRPMDRLVCGDVGYGKTEVAMRAVFKAVMDLKQAAVLVPTTLLAQQHGQTFRERFAPFPVRVETLSRFRSAKDQKDVLAGMADGRVDIVIGTHRLLQKDVAFRDLGLLIVDEEQRFGVTHKEKLRQLRKNVDTLTLTATPIPRTLQMGLVGIRDLSVIETPPPDRLAIRTILTRFDRAVIRSAILREISRGGQVFFVHNRVHDIARLGEQLVELVPEARIAVAHGQMNERQLETVMLRFVHQEANVLVTTAIIESGLDIPTANTILINDAHRFGLADLYQLRGRVGRSGHQAFAYLLVPSERVPNEEARARMEAIQEFCELGAGFRIAARDLEIRGSGNVLGTQQSGHIAAVGFETYLEMIEQCMRELRGVEAEESVEPTLTLNLSAYISEDYVPDTDQRLSLYKRLSGVRSEEELSAIRSELIDRYGEVPTPVRHLLQVVDLKVLARDLKIHKIESVRDGFLISFDPHHRLSEEQVARLMSESSQRLTLVSEFGIKLNTRFPQGDDGPEGELSGFPVGSKRVEQLRSYLKTLQ